MQQGVAFRGRAVHPGWMPVVCWVLLGALAGPLACCAAAVSEGRDSGVPVSLSGALKITSLLSHAPHDPHLFPDRNSAVGLARLRLELGTKPTDWLDSKVAYEQRASLVSKGAGAAGGGVLPSSAKAPFRIRQLDWSLARHGDTFSCRHEIDRALVALHPAWGEAVLGRQAIGLGRGVLFGAVDLFAPFSPTEVDREWRRGVDAVRCEVRLSDTASAELLSAFGERWDESAVVGRVRGYVGKLDAEILLGKRARDFLCGATVSAAVGDAEAHLELALFDTPEAQPDGGLLGNDHLVPKAVLGSSYTFDVGNGLTVLGEYHYSGFGMKDVEDVAERLTEPDFQERLVRGDMQILGRHALGLQASYPINNVLTGALLALHSPADGSGLLSPSVAWNATENVSVLASGFLPWGAGPSRGNLKSEYGGTPVSLFVQVSAYF